MRRDEFGTTLGAVPSLVNPAWHAGWCRSRRWGKGPAEPTLRLLEWLPIQQRDLPQAMAELQEHHKPMNVMNLRNGQLGRWYGSSSE